MWLCIKDILLTIGGVFFLCAAVCALLKKHKMFHLMFLTTFTTSMVFMAPAMWDINKVVTVLSLVLSVVLVAFNTYDYVKRTDEL